MRSQFQNLRSYFFNTTLERINIEAKYEANFVLKFKTRHFFYHYKLSFVASVF